MKSGIQPPLCCSTEAHPNDGGHVRSMTMVKSNLRPVQQHMMARCGGSHVLIFKASTSWVIPFSNIKSHNRRNPRNIMICSYIKYIMTAGCPCRHTRTSPNLSPSHLWWRFQDWIHIWYSSSTLHTKMYDMAVHVLASISTKDDKPKRHVTRSPTLVVTILIGYLRFYL